MAYWSIALLLISVTFLAFRHPTTALDSLPQWIRPAKRRDRANPVDEDLTTSSDGATDINRIKEPPVRIEVEEHSEAENTPKAKATQSTQTVPSFSLSEEVHPEETQPLSPKPRRPNLSSLAANSAERASSMPPPLKPNAVPAQNGAASLMPPPPRPTSVPSQNSPVSLRIPSNGPLPNRGPPGNSQQRASGGLTVNGTVPTPNPRGKVLLSPGHSPMDWAALTRKGNLSGVSTFQRVTPSMLKTMTGRKGKPAWSTWQGHVYNITPYIPFHPGGEAEIMRAAGRDGTRLFLEVHPWVNWENMLGTCLVGVMVPEDHGAVNNEGSSLESLD